MVTEVMARVPGAVTLAVGDGANDSELLFKLLFFICSRLFRVFSLLRIPTCQVVCALSFSVSTSTFAFLSLLTTTCDVNSFHPREYGRPLIVHTRASTTANMIKAAHVGVGIAGIEGTNNSQQRYNYAVLSTHFSFSHVLIL
jgi:hypothetical protein